MKETKTVRVRRPGVIPKGYRRTKDGNLIKIVVETKTK